MENFYNILYNYNHKIEKMDNFYKFVKSKKVVNTKETLSPR